MSRPLLGLGRPSVAGMPLERLDRLCVCPECREALPDPVPDECASCGRPLRREGVLDFLTDRTSEHDHYEEFYRATATTNGNARLEDHATDLDARVREYLSRLWTTPYYPMNRQVLAEVGDVAGKVVVLL